MANLIFQIQLSVFEGIYSSTNCELGHLLLLTLYWEEDTTKQILEKLDGLLQQFYSVVFFSINPWVVEMDSLKTCITCHIFPPLSELLLPIQQLFSLDITKLMFINIC